MTQAPVRRTPRNHTRRVEDLQDLDRRGVIRFVQSDRPDPRKPWVYTVEVLGEVEDIPTRHIDTWLRAWRQAVAVMTGTGGASAVNGDRHAL